MSLETEIAGLTTSTTNLTSAVAVQQQSVSASVAEFQAITDIVNNELNNVENIADLDKVTSTATSASLATKQLNLVDGSNISTVNGISLLTGTPLVVARSATSMRTLSYNGRDTLRTAVAPLPIADDSVIIDSIGQFIFVETFGEPDDDETCFTTTSTSSNTVIGQWLLNLPHPDYTNATHLFYDSIIDEWMEDTDRAHLLAQNNLHT